MAGGRLVRMVGMDAVVVVGMEFVAVVLGDRVGDGEVVGV